MLIYAEQSLNIFYIQGVTEGPVTDFFIERSGDSFNIGRYSSGIYEVQGLAYGDVQNGSLGYFATADDAYSYLVSLTVPTFPLRFTVSYPLQIDQDRPNVKIDPVFIETRIDMVDGQNF